MSLKTVSNRDHDGGRWRGDAHKSHSHVAAPEVPECPASQPDSFAAGESFTRGGENIRTDS